MSEQAGDYVPCLKHGRYPCGKDRCPDCCGGEEFCCEPIADLREHIEYTERRLHAMLQSARVKFDRVTELQERLLRADRQEMRRLRNLARKLYAAADDDSRIRHVSQVEPWLLEPEER